MADILNYRRRTDTPSPLFREHQGVIIAPKPSTVKMSMSSASSFVTSPDSEVMKSLLLADTPVNNNKGPSANNEPASLKLKQKQPASSPTRLNNL